MCTNRGDLRWDQSERAPGNWWLSVLGHSIVVLGLVLLMVAIPSVTCFVCPLLVVILGYVSAAGFDQQRKYGLTQSLFLMVILLALFSSVLAVILGTRS